MTTRNTHEWTVAEVRDAATTNEHPIPLRVRDMLTAYADDLDRRAEGVTDDVLIRMGRVIAQRAGESWDDIGEFAQQTIKDTQRAALLAVWPVAAEPVAQGEAKKHEVPCAHSWERLYTGTGRWIWECRECFKRGGECEYASKHPEIATEAYNHGYRAALAAQPLAVPDGWQPIETAPRDGTVIDLWHVGGMRITEQWWDVEDACWCGLGDDNDFSHWMPLPAAPQSGEPKS